MKRRRLPKYFRMPGGENVYQLLAERTAPYRDATTVRDLATGLTYIVYTMGGIVRLSRKDVDHYLVCKRLEGKGLNL